MNANNQFKHTLVNVALMTAVTAMATGCGGGGGSDSPPPPSTSADLTLAMTAAPNPVVVNNVLSYQVTITNNGPSTTSDVNITHSLSEGAADVVADGCNVSSNTVTCSIGTLDNGKSATRSIRLKPSIVGAFINTARVSGSEPDPNTENNRIEVSTDVQAAHQKQADLSLTLTANRESVSQDNPVDYQLEVKNNGPDQANSITLSTNLKLTDAALSGVTDVQASGCEIGRDQASGLPVTCKFESLNAGATTTINLTATPTESNGTLVHTANVSATESDPDNANNKASSEIVVVKPAQLSISGNPEPQAYVGFGYQFMPKLTKENENDVVVFSIENKPKWMILDPKTGEISGFPSEEDIGLYTDIQLDVTDDHETKNLRFAIEVKSWQGFGYCSGTNTSGENLCTPISSSYVTDAQCQVWSSVEGLKNPVLHTDDRQDVLEADAKNVCNTPPASGNQCPLGKIAIPQDVGDYPAIACMDDLPISELTEKSSEQMTRDLDNYLSDSEKDALPDFKPAEPQITGPDANGNYTVTLPPDISQQNELEKQRRGQDFGEILNYFTDCSRLVDGGSFWNKAVCFSWKRPFGDDQVGAIVDAMTYMKVSGEAAASAKVTGKLLGYSAELVKVFGKTQVYALPEQYVNGLNEADAIIKAANNGDATETLNVILNKSPTLQGGIAQVSPELTNAVKDAKKVLDRATDQVKAALSKTQAEIEKAKAKFVEAEAQLNKAIAAFNEAKAAAEGVLQSLTAAKSEIAGSLEIWQPGFSSGQWTGKLTTIWSENKQAANGQPLSYLLTVVNEMVEVFHASQQFTIVVVPVNVQETLTANPKLVFKASIIDPLQANKAAVMLELEPNMGLDLSVSAGVGNEFASAGVEGKVKVIDPRWAFSLTARAREFPELPLAVMSWQAEVLNGRIVLYAGLKVTVMKVVQQISQKVVNWLTEMLDIKTIQIPEIKISKYEKELFKFKGFHIPEVQTCNQPQYRNQAILYCSRPNECFVDTCENENQQFVDQGNGEIKDQKTGFIWKKEIKGAFSPSPETVCTTLPNGEQDCTFYPGASSIAHHCTDGWRLPSVTELQTLVSPTPNQIGLYIQPLFSFDGTYQSYLSRLGSVMIMSTQSCGGLCMLGYDFGKLQATQTGPDNDSKGGISIGISCVR